MNAVIMACERSSFHSFPDEGWSGKFAAHSERAACVKAALLDRRGLQRRNRLFGMIPSCQGEADGRPFFSTLRGGFMQ
jgi:hypothetical protein